MHLDIGPFQLTSTFLRLRPDASVEPLAVDGAFWQKLTTGQLGNFHNEYMVGTHAFEADWPMWEMHPNGEEIVYLLSGSTAFHSRDGRGLTLIHAQRIGQLFDRAKEHVAYRKNN